MFYKLKSRIQQKGRVLSEEVWNEIEQHAEVLSLKKNEVLIEYGSRHKYVYFVAQGGFMTSLITENGKKRAVWFHLEEVFEMATCMDSYFLNEPTKYEVKAIEDSTVIRFNKPHVDLWVLKYPSFNQIYIADIIADYIAVNEMRAFKLAHAPLEFLDYINQKYPIIATRVSSKNMAHFLGVSPEWYSKLKKKIEP